MKLNYLILFKSDSKKYAIETTYVREIILIKYFERVPGSFDHIAGITVHRGTLIPLYFINGFDLIGIKNNLYAIIIYAKEKFIGFICSEANIVLQENLKIIDEKEIKIDYNYDKKILNSIIKIDEEIYGLLDYEKLINYYIENKGGLNESKDINSR